MINRRTLLAGIAPGAALGLAACANGTLPVSISPTGQITVNLPSAVNDAIAQAVATVAKYLPTAETIASAAAGLFGPTYASIVTVGSAALNQLIAFLQSVVTTAPAASKKLMATLLKGTSPWAPATLAVSKPLQFAPRGVTIQGYSIH
jgi:hypothetical protein